MPETKRYPPEQLFDFTVAVFRHFEVPTEDARLAATVLQSADLRGIDSHGVARLASYADFLGRGRINPRPNISIVRQSPSTATVDGDNGLGLVVGPKANEIAMAKAASAGSGWVSVRNTNHYGIAGWYVLEALNAVLSGANWGPFAPPFALRQEVPTRSVGKGIGHFFGALRIDAFIDPAEFKRQIDDMVKTLRATKPAPGTSGPLIPGNPERLAEIERRRDGIPLVPAVVDELRDVARQTGVAFPS